ncbi:MAG: hypothetical protein QOG50_959, partial [Actinomycetota bacterium]|nr:hypothetical protein [Actinomycetota bacterium]
ITDTTNASAVEVNEIVQEKSH